MSETSDTDTFGDWLAGMRIVLAILVAAGLVAVPFGQLAGPSAALVGAVVGGVVGFVVVSYLFYRE